MPQSGRPVYYTQPLVHLWYTQQLQSHLNIFWRWQDSELYQKSGCTEWRDTERVLSPVVLLCCCSPSQVGPHAAFRSLPAFLATCSFHNNTIRSLLCYRQCVVKKSFFVFSASYAAELTTGSIQQTLWNTVNSLSLLKGKVWVVYFSETCSHLKIYNLDKIPGDYKI